MPTSPAKPGARARRRASPRRRARSRSWRARSPPAATARQRELVGHGAVEPHVSAKMSRPPRRSRQRSDQKPSRTRLAHGGRPNTIASARAATRRRRDRRRCGATSRARSNRMVSCGSQASRPPAAHRQRDVERGVGAGRAVDFSAAAVPAASAGARADVERDGEAVAAGHAAAGVDEHRFQRVARHIGQAHAQRACLLHALAPRHAVRRRDASAMRPLARLAAKIVLAVALAVAGPPLTTGRPASLPSARRRDPASGMTELKSPSRARARLRPWSPCRSHRRSRRGP